MMCMCVSASEKWIILRGQSFELLHLGQYVLVLNDVFIGGQQDVELPTAELRNEPTAQHRGALPWERRREKDNFLSGNSHSNKKN